MYILNYKIQRNHQPYIPHTPPWYLILITNVQRDNNSGCFLFLLLLLLFCFWRMYYINAKCFLSKPAKLYWTQVCRKILCGTKRQTFKRRSCFDLLYWWWHYPEYLFAIMKSILYIGWSKRCIINGCACMYWICCSVILVVIIIMIISRESKV